MTQPENGTTESTDNDPPLGVLSPLPLAEQLSPEDLTNQLAFAHNNTDEWRADRRLLRQAGAELEMHLALPPNDGRAIDRFDDFRVYLERILHNKEAHFDNIADAQILEAYLTPFQLRQQHVQTLNDRQQMVLRRCLGGVIQKVDDLIDSPTRKQGYHTKLALHLLMNRTNLLYYPATSRENSSRYPGYASLHHDGYAILDGAKVPIKLRGSEKNEREYTRSKVCHISHIKLAIEALKETTGSMYARGNYIQESVAILEREAYGERLEGYERRWVDKITELAEQRVRDFHRMRNGA